MRKLSLRVSREHRRARPQPRDEPGWRQRQPRKAQPSSWSCAFSLTVRFSATRPLQLPVCVTLYPRSHSFIYVTKHSVLGEFPFWYLSAFVFCFFFSQFFLYSWVRSQNTSVNLSVIFLILIYLYTKGPWWAEKPKDREQWLLALNGESLPPLYSCFMLCWGHTTWFYFSSHENF